MIAPEPGSSVLESSSLDHVALEVGDLDATIAVFEMMGLELRRRGTRTGTGQRLALVGTSGGVKVELVEVAGRHGATFDHVAFRVDDVTGAHDRLIDDGFTSLRGPATLSAAKAETAMLSHSTGLVVQVIDYEHDSPDR